MTLTVGSLFSGIGGLELGLERAGMSVRWQVEFDPFCQAVLAKHWPDAVRFGDVHEVGAHNLEAVDVICGGFPCQPISQAGKQLGRADERWLWPQFARIIRELRPRYVLVENVANLRSMEHGGLMGEVLGDLAASGYDAEWSCIPASAVGAPHRRDRIWIVAHRDRRDAPERGERADAPQGSRGGSHERGGGHDDAEREVTVLGAVEDPRSVADADRPGRGEQRGSIAVRAEQPAAECSGAFSGVGDTDDGRREQHLSGERGVSVAHEAGRRGAESELGRVLDGLSLGLDGHRWPAPPGPQHDWEPPRVVAGEVANKTRRLKAIGNAVVPQIPEAIGRAIVAHDSAYQHEGEQK